MSEITQENETKKPEGQKERKSCGTAEEYDGKY